MNWLKSTIIKWALRNESRRIQFDESQKMAVAMHKEDPAEFNNESVRFHLTPAVGGRILKVIRDGDNRRNTLGPSDNSTQLYVIPSGEDVGARVAKIINMELMK
jgi:hypothetical protein